MKISILIAARDARPFLPAALASVRAQTHANRELILVEDGSRDGTEELLRRFAEDCPHTVLYSNLGESQGVAAVRNRLLDLATGDAMAFLDADDTWEPGHLADAAAALADGAGVAVAGVRVFDLADGRTRGRVIPPPALLRRPALALFQQSVIVTSSSVVLRRALAERAGPFDRSFRIGEDRDYWLRCALAGGRFARIAGLTCGYAKHPGSAMARTLLVAGEAIRFYEKYQALATIPPRLRRRRLAESLVAHGRLLRRSDALRSAACFWRAWRCTPLDPVIPCHLALTGWRSVAAARPA